MSQIFVTGDVHQTHDILKLRMFRKGDGAQLTKDDYVIVCGDFGLLWSNPYTLKYYGEEGFSLASNPKDKYWNNQEYNLLRWYDACPWTTLWVDGNHENFDRLETYPVTEWNCGHVQKISDSVIHLMRGEVYEIDGRKIFCFGGAMSTDRGPAVGDEEESIYKWWWPQEIYNDKEAENAYDNLEKNNCKVDFIITHDCPAGVNQFNRYRISKVSNFLEQIRQTTNFTHWYCGHMHFDDDFGKVSVLYKRIVPLGKFVNED